jgi:tetratricopeptide (TPR) repeat protein
LSEQGQSVLAEESTRRMVAGLGAMAREDWLQALGHFEGAVELRERLAWRSDPESAWMLAAAWINRGDAMLRLGQPELLQEAVMSFDRVIEAMQYVPLERNPAFVERLALAWINRGTACGEQGDFEDASAGFSQAEKIIAEREGRMTPELRFMEAMLRVNRARFLIEAGHPVDAWEDVGIAIRILRNFGTSPPVITAAIKARCIRCRSLALLLEEPGGAERVGDWIAEATDSTEEALALVKASGYRDEWVADLVRYGARIYQACQPHFLGEFLAEWLGPEGPLAADETLRQEMRNSLLVAQFEVERKVLLLPQDTEFVEKQTKILKALQAGMKAIA